MYAGGAVGDTARRSGPHLNPEELAAGSEGELVQVQPNGEGKVNVDRPPADGSDTHRSTPRRPMMSRGAGTFNSPGSSIVQ
jgi:hypothetical protein